MRYILTFNECSLKCCNSDILFNQCLELRWRQSSQFSYIEQLWITSTDRFSRQFMNLGPDILPQYRQVKEYVYIYYGHVYISIKALILHTFIKENWKYYYHYYLLLLRGWQESSVIFIFVRKKYWEYLFTASQQLWRGCPYIT